jgi:site-specific DNA recombinase
MPGNAIIYCRVSSDRQATEGHGLDGQERRCREFAAAHGFSVIGVFRDEGASGGTIDRPALQDMFAYMRRSRDVDIVLFEDVSRIARDMEVHIQILSQITRLGATYQTVNQPVEQTFVGKFITQSMANVAEFHRNLNAQNVKNRMRARLQSGYWVFENPPGYTYQTLAGHGRLLVPYQPVSDIVASALVGFASGRFEKQADVRDYLEENGLQRHRRGSGPIYPEQVRRLLTRVLYAGYLECRKFGVPLSKAQHEPLISLDTFYRIQEKLAAKAPVLQSRKDLAQDFPLRGFVLCSGCRKPYTASWNRGRSKKYAYYRCDQVGCDCYNKSVPKKKLESEFEVLLHGVQPSPQLLEIVRVALLGLWNERFEDFRGGIETQQRACDAIDQAIKKYCNKVLEVDSKVLIQAYEKKIDELTVQKLRLGSRIEVDTERLDQFDFGTALSKVFQFIKEPYQIWKTGHLGLKRAMLRIVFREPLVYSVKTGFGTATLSLPLEIATVCKSDPKLVVELLRKSWNHLDKTIREWNSVLQDAQAVA